MISPIEYNGSILAYIGDAYYELLIRKHFIKDGNVKSNLLHKKVTKFTNAKSHYIIAKVMIDEDFFSEEELDLFKKGRNSKSKSVRRSASINEYSYSTGFECVIGYNYLVGNINRVDEIVEKAILILNE